MILKKFYGSVTIRLEAGKVMHVETESREMRTRRDLPITISTGKLVLW